MDVQRLAQEIDEWEEKFAEADARATAAISEREAIRSIISGLRKYMESVRGSAGPVLFDLPEPEPTENGAAPTPRGREAVLRIVTDENREMHIGEIVRAAQAREWMTDVESPRNALSAAAKRLVQDGKLAKGRKRASYRPLALESEALETG